MDSDETTEKTYDWKTLGISISLTDPAFCELIKQKIAAAEDRMIRGLQESMFPPLTPEEEAAYALLEIERKRPINRLRRFCRKWQDRLCNAWDALRGGLDYGDYDD